MYFNTRIQLLSLKTSKSIWRSCITERQKSIRTFETFPKDTKRANFMVINQNNNLEMDTAINFNTPFLYMVVSKSEDGHQFIVSMGRFVSFYMFLHISWMTHYESVTSIHPFVYSHARSFQPFNGFESRRDGFLAQRTMRQYFFPDTDFTASLRIGSIFTFAFLFCPPSYFFVVKILHVVIKSESISADNFCRLIPKKSCYTAVSWCTPPFIYSFSWEFCGNPIMHYILSFVHPPVHTLNGFYDSSKTNPELLVSGSFDFISEYSLLTSLCTLEGCVENDFWFGY